jgi:hypothetical protein
MSPFLRDEIFISPELGWKKVNGWQKVAKIGVKEKEKGILSHFSKNGVAIFHTSYVYKYILRDDRKEKIFVLL